MKDKKVSIRIVFPFVMSVSIAVCIISCMFLFSHYFSGYFFIYMRLIYVRKINRRYKGGVKVTKEQLGVLILDCERQLYSTAKTILYSDQDCADAIQDTIVKSIFQDSNIEKMIIMPEHG